jgi:hypothetical protein
VPSADAEAAIRRTYDALTAKDHNAYIDSIDPQVRNQPSLGPLLTLGTQLLTGATVDFENIAFRDMQYQTTSGDPSWAVVHVTGFIRNLQFEVEDPVDALEVAHQVQGKWYTSTIAAYGQSPEGRADAAVLDRRDAARRQLVRVTKIEPPQSDTKEIWWPTTIYNGDLYPHQAHVAIVGLRQHAQPELPAFNDDIAHPNFDENFTVAPRTATVVKPAIQLSAWDSNGRGNWDPASKESATSYLAAVDGYSTLDPSVVWSQVSISSDQGIPSLTPAPSGNLYNASVSCDNVSLNYSGDVFIAVKVDLKGTITHTIRGDKSTEQFSYTYGSTPSGLASTVQLGAILAPQQGVLVFGYNFLGRSLVPPMSVSTMGHFGGGDTLDITKAIVTLGLNVPKENSANLSQEFPIAGCSIAAPQ